MKSLSQLFMRSVLKIKEQINNLMRFDQEDDKKTSDEMLEMFTRKAAIILAFISVYFFFFKIVFF